MKTDMSFCINAALAILLFALALVEVLLHGVNNNVVMFSAFGYIFTQFAIGG